MSLMFPCFVLFLGFQLKSIESAPSKCECELMTECELQKAYQELECFAKSFTCTDIKNKILEFLQLFKAVPRDKITKKRFCAAAPLVRTALTTLNDNCLTVKEKLDGIDALMAILGLVQSPCVSAEIDSSIWDEWIEGISHYLREREPVPTLVPPAKACA